MSLTLQQKKYRQKGIGGSDVAAIFGISKWKTPLQIYFDKTSEPIEEDINQDDARYIGNILEPVIIKEFEKRYNKICITNYNDGEPFIHPKYPFILANVDALIKGEKAAFEAKTARFSKDWGITDTDDIPKEYLLQVAHYSAVLDLEKVYIGVFTEMSLRYYEYKKNEQLEKIIIEKEIEWWEKHIINDIPPEPMNTIDINILWPKSNKIIKEADIEILESLDIIKKNKNLINQLDKEVLDHKLKINNYMQDAEILGDYYGNLLATWKNQTTNRFDIAKFKKAYPDLYKQFTKPNTTRVFKINNDKD